MGPIGNSSWHNLLDPFRYTRGNAKNAFTTWQDVAGDAANLFTLPRTLGNELRAGTQIHLHAQGEYSALTAATLQLGFIYGATPSAVGGTIVAQNAAFTLGTTPASWPWRMFWDGVVNLENGTASTIYGMGTVEIGSSLTAFQSTGPVVIPATAAARSVTIDTTVRAAWGVGAAWGASSASNQVIVDLFRAEIVNQGKS